MPYGRTLAAIVLAVVVAPWSLAQTSLKLPSGDDDFRELIEEPRGGPCERCGVVTAIRQQAHEGPRQRPPAPAIAPSLVSAPIIGTGSVVEDARQVHAPLLSYVVTVRYEDGTYAFIEQHDEPTVRKGDRVRVVDGRVELRND